MSEDRKAALVCWTMAVGKVAAIFAVALLLLALAGAADTGHAVVSFGDLR